nr:MAG TPA: hypothetical protein [Caudoviricetes sp.]
MNVDTFKNSYYDCYVQVYDLETKNITIRASIRSDVWYPHTTVLHDIPIKDSDTNEIVRSVLLETFDNYLYPRLILSYPEQFKKNFKILDKFFKNDFVCTGSARTEPIGIPMIKRPTEEELAIYPNLCLTFERAYIFWNWNDELAMRNSSINDSKCPLLEYKFYIYNNKTELETVECDTAFFHDDDSIIKNNIFNI